MTPAPPPGGGAGCCGLDLFTQSPELPVVVVVVLLLLLCCWFSLVLLGVLGDFGLKGSPPLVKASPKQLGLGRSAQHRPLAILILLIPYEFRTGFGAGTRSWAPRICECPPREAYSRLGRATAAASGKPGLSLTLASAILRERRGHWSEVRCAAFRK